MSGQRRDVGLGLAALLLALSLASAAQAAPTQALHSLAWFVHEDLLDAQHDLAFYQQLIEDRLGEAEILVQGFQGPADTPCCVAFDAVTVTTFSGVGLDIIENQAELDALLGGPSGAYLVQSVWFCTGTASTTILGCGVESGESFVVSLDADASDLLPLVIAHERGHNAGLPHVAGDPCALMTAARGGGCLSVSECQSYLAKADSSSGVCDCLADGIGDPHAADATACSNDLGAGLCSGGVCGVPDGPAGTRLLTAGGGEDPVFGVPDDALNQSPLSGGWETLGAIGPGVAATGLAYDSGRDVVFATAPQSGGNDQLIRLDPVTGAKTGTIATLGMTGLTALAFDPAGDRLFAIQADAEIFGNPYPCGAPPCISALIEIDPDSGAASVLGELNALIVDGAVQGLAWDSAAGVLYGSTAAGLYEIGLSCQLGACPGTVQIDSRYRWPSSLAYDASTGTLYRQGAVLGRSELDVIDPASGEAQALIGIDGMTPGGMTVIPVPEPGRCLMLASGIAALVTLGARRRSPVV